MSTAIVDTKALGVVEISLKAITGPDAAAGEFEAVLSAPTLDRDGEVVAAKAFDPLPEWIPIDIDHRMGVRDTVGSGQPFYEGDILKLRGSFASTELGQEVRTLVKEGHIRKMSVVFMNPKREVRDGVPHVVKAELLNAAIVTIPANREADITDAKRALSRKVGARNSAKDAETIQEIHDKAAELGASCELDDDDTEENSAEKRARVEAAKSVSFKTVEGSYEQRAEQLRAAIRTANPDAFWVRIVATFDDRVVYHLESWSDDGGTYEATYSFDDNGVTLGSAEAVEITEMVIPAKDADVDPDRKAAANAAACAPADAALAVLRAEVDELETLIPS